MNIKLERIDRIISTVIDGETCYSLMQEYPSLNKIERTTFNKSIRRLFDPYVQRYECLSLTEDDNINVLFESHSYDYPFGITLESFRRNFPELLV